MESIVRKREKNNIKQAEAARSSKVTQAMYSMIENGKRKPTEDVVKMWEKWGVPKYEIVCLEHSEKWESFWAGFQRGRRCKKSYMIIAKQLFKDWIIENKTKE